MTTTSYEWVLFDADNTLFDFTAGERASLQQALEDEGLEFSDSYHALYHRINKECWSDFEHGRISKEQLRRERFVRFFGDLGQRGIDADGFAANYLAYLSQTGQLLDGAQPLLESLQNRYRLGLITNGLKEVQRPRLAASGLGAFFEVVVVSDEIGVAKPQQAFFDFTFGLMGQPAPNQVLVVGDNLHADIKGGLDYGADACWYNPDGHEPLPDIRPTYQVKTLHELARMLVG